MKKVLISFTIVLSTMISLAHAQVKSNEVTTTGTTQNNEPVTYRLFSTQNIWNFIKLDTRNGKMWQVQWSTDSDKRFTTGLSLIPLVAKEDEKIGRFTLHPTQNSYNFLLIDQLDGRVWQVQWSIDPDKRVVIPIE
jgi:hypothetical protein